MLWGGKTWLLIFRHRSSRMHNCQKVLLHILSNIELYKFRSIFLRVTFPNVCFTCWSLSSWVDGLLIHLQAPSTSPLRIKIYQVHLCEILRFFIVCYKRRRYLWSHFSSLGKEGVWRCCWMSYVFCCRLQKYAWKSLLAQFGVLWVCLFWWVWLWDWKKGYCICD